MATMLGAAAAAREMTAGRLTAAERNDIDRAIARLQGQATLDAAFAEGHRDPQAVLKLAIERDSSGRDGITGGGLTVIRLVDSCRVKIAPNLQKSITSFRLPT